jgi:hypothetical protein
VPVVRVLQVATRAGGARAVNYSRPRNFMIGRFVGTLARPLFFACLLACLLARSPCASDDNEDIRFSGQIAEVRLWNIVRTAAQIAQSYQVPITTATANLVASWRMTQVRSIPSLAYALRKVLTIPMNMMNVQVGPGGPVTDASGNGHVAALGGVPAFISYGCSAAGMFLPLHRTFFLELGANAHASIYVSFGVQIARAIRRVCLPSPRLPRLARGVCLTSPLMPRG